MKASNYNTFFEQDNMFVGYNAFSNEFIVIEPLLYDLYCVGLKRNDFSELADIHKEFYDFLIYKGFAVSNEIDEFQRVKSLSQTIDNNDSQFHLIVNPTMNCNFKCWYCYESHIKDSKMDDSTIQSVIKLTSNVLDNQKGIKRFVLSFFGGEPLLYFSKVIRPLLTDVSSMLKDRKVEMVSHMTTNGLLLNLGVIEECKRLGLSSFQITLDGSKEQHDKVRFISEGKGSYDKIISNIITAAKNKLFVNVRINCSEETFNNIQNIAFDFMHLPKEVRDYLAFDFQKVWQVVTDISEDMNNAKKHFKEMGLSVTTSGNGTVLDSCYADKRYQATLNYNGEVFKCTARDFTNGSGEGKLDVDGTIIWNDKFESRLNSKFNNAPCRSCRILPLCGGGCTQAAIESQGDDYCVMGFDEDLKTSLVKEKFLEVCS